METKKRTKKKKLSWKNTILILPTHQFLLHVWISMGTLWVRVWECALVTTLHQQLHTLAIWILRDFLNQLISGPHKNQRKQQVEISVKKPVIFMFFFTRLNHYFLFKYQKKYYMYWAHSGLISQTIGGMTKSGFSLNEKLLMEEF